MSLENKIDELTAAIKEQTAVNAGLAAAIIALRNSGAPTPEVTEPKQGPKKEAKVAETPKEEPKAEAPKEEPKAEEPKAETPKDEPKAEEVKVPALPAGERNMQYYEKHVRPKLIEVGKQSRDKLIAIGQKFGVTNCKDVPADKWDDLFAEALNALAGA